MKYKFQAFSGSEIWAIEHLIDRTKVLMLKPIIKNVKLVVLNSIIWFSKYKPSPIVTLQKADLQKNDHGYKS